MLTLPSSVRVFICLAPADMRRSLDGLAAITREIIREHPLSGHLFAFFNRRRDRTKILFWDRSGLCLYYKRLEKGVFRLSALEHSNRKRAEIEATDLTFILEGIDLSGGKASRAFRSSKECVIPSSFEVCFLQQCAFLF